MAGLLACAPEEVFVGSFDDPLGTPTLDPLWSQGPARLDDVVAFGDRVAVVYALEDGHYLSLVDRAGEAETFRVSNPLDTLRGAVQPLDDDRYRYVWQNHFRRADWSAFASEQRIGEAVDVRAAFLLSSEVEEAIGPEIAPHPLGSVVAFRSRAGVSLRFVGFDGSYRLIADFFPGHRLGSADRLLVDGDRGWLVTRAQGEARLHLVDLEAGGWFEQSLGEASAADVALSAFGPLLAVSTATASSLSRLVPRGPTQFERASTVSVFDGSMGRLQMAADDAGWIVAATAGGTLGVHVACGRTPEGVTHSGDTGVVGSRLALVSHGGRRFLAVGGEDEMVQLFAVRCAD